VGKHRGEPAGAVYDRLHGLDMVMLFTLWDEVKTRVGSRVIWSAAGVLLGGIIVLVGFRILDNPADWQG